MADMIKSLDALLLEAAAELGAGGSYDGAKVGLYVNAILPDENTLLADLTQPAFTGYALSSAVVWGGLGVDELNRVISVAGIKEFAPSAIVTGEIAYGAFLVDGAGTTLLAIYPFDTPFNFVATTSRCRVAAYAVFGNSSGGPPVVET